MKFPRDLSGTDLAKALEQFGYKVTRQTGSHMSLTTQQVGEHHLTVPCHDPVKIGTLRAILSDVSEHFGLTREELLEILFD